MSIIGLSKRSKPFLAAIKGAITQGFNAADTMRILQKTYGRGYQKSIFLSDYRLLSGAKDVFEPMKTVRKDYKPTDRLYKMSSTPHERKYATVVDYTYKIRDDKTLYTDHYTLRHDNLLTVREMEEEILSLIERDYEVIEATVIAAREGYRFKKP